MFSLNEGNRFVMTQHPCDIVGVKPLQWLTHALERLRTDSTEDEITALLPYNYKKSQE